MTSFSKRKTLLKVGKCFLNSLKSFICSSSSHCINFPGGEMGEGRGVGVRVSFSLHFLFIKKFHLIFLIYFYKLSRCINVGWGVVGCKFPFLYIFCLFFPKGRLSFSNSSEGWEREDKKNSKKKKRKF